MKKLIIVLLISLPLFAQQFTVQKVTGRVEALKGTSENWEPVKAGDILASDDLISTFENAFIQLESPEGKFILKSNSALGLDMVKSISINDLLLALALEEIRNLPKTKGSEKVINTAVYGAEITGEVPSAPARNFGAKKLNGAKQLAENGFNESAIIAAKDTYRNYPETRKMVRERLIFADILLDLNLWQEAASEIEDIRKHDAGSEFTTQIGERLEKINKQMTEE